ncbi:12147_t:CDS:2, partial [Gigaspora margarita]
GLPVKKKSDNSQQILAPANKMAEDIEMEGITVLILRIETASSTVGNDYNGKDDFEMDVEYIERENYFVQ